MYTVQVLLSTYNGEKYIKEQIDSILKQKDVNVRLLIRDDGSTDGTNEILLSYALNNENVFYYRGENSGVVASFFRLFETADFDVDFYALADQDDVWEEDKLIVACRQLEAMRTAKDVAQHAEASVPSDSGSQKTSGKKRGKKKKKKQQEVVQTAPADESPIRTYRTPLLYCGASLNTNEALEPCPNQDIASGYDIVPDFRNALIENIARGGSIVFNHGLMTYVRIAMPQDIYMHDWWLYLVASCFGEVFYDATPHYKYRQHEGNVLGAATGGKLKKLRRRLIQSKTNGGHVSRQAKAFERVYHVPKDKLEYVRILTQYQTSKKYRRMGRSGEYLFRQNPSDQKIFRLMFKTNHL